MQRRLPGPRISRGPVLHAQTRVGRWGRCFTLYKIRSMFDDCAQGAEPRWATSRDPHITVMGRVLRWTHLDELPQLWNVLRGDMSLVGPRPERITLVPLLAQAIPNYYARLAVRPGITGLAQVQLPPDTDLVSVRRKLKLDLYYAQHVSAGLDLHILLGTTCYLLGVPFYWLPEPFRVPSPEMVDLDAVAPRG